MHVAGQLTVFTGLFYRELLEFFQELHGLYDDPLQREFILWNNKEIMIENKSVFWKTWLTKNVVFVQVLLDSQGNFLSFQGFSEKYSIDVNFLKYYQLFRQFHNGLNIMPWPVWTSGNYIVQLPFESPVCQLSDDIVLDLNKIYCKQIYKLFVEKIDVEATAIKS